MTVLLVQAHPLEDSYNAAIRDRLIAGFDANRRPVEAFRLATGERPTVDDLADATELVLVYPTWSGGLPAMVLDWAHSVLDQPSALSNVHHLTAVTTCGSSKFINTVQGEWGLRYLKTAMLEHCQPGARFKWVPLYKIDRRTPAEITAHLDRVTSKLGVTAKAT
ncbi:MAG: NAD(P)H-dependent oxidoreductase [Acidimicrobiales bacterium]